MQIESEARVGYVGVDILNNATICNETTALVERGVPLDLVSVYQIDNPTFYQSDSIVSIRDRIRHIYPLRPGRMVLDLLLGLFVFRWRFLVTLAKALRAEVEGPRERIKVLGHLLPGLRLAFMWRKRQIQHVHCQWAHTATTIGMHAAEFLGVGFSFMGHANDLFVHRVALVNKVRRARFILCISEYHRRFYMELGADPNRLHVVYCGISLDRFQNLPNTPRTDKRIVSVGRLVEKKGFDVLIMACGQLQAQGEDFHCTIAGSGPEEQNLRELICELRLEDRVSITGKAILQEDIPAFLSSATLFALPCVQDSEGDMDGLPQVLIESMACRVPVVSTHLVGIPDLVRHELNGLLVETRNVDACAAALNILLNDDARRAQFAACGVEWVHDHFSRNELAERLASIFEWALATPGENPPPTLFPAAPGAELCYAAPKYLTDGSEFHLPVCVS